jgi:small GTP-binding protein
MDVAREVSKKICLLGDFAVGKTSLVHRFVYDRFDDKYISTIGVKVSRKVVMVPHDASNSVTKISLLIWDLAGSQEFHSLQSSYLRGASGAILVCDLTRPATLDSLPRYLESLQRLVDNAQLAVVANKADLADQRSISEETLAQTASALNAPYYVTSAKDGNQVETLFRCMATALVD